MKERAEQHRGLGASRGKPYPRRYACLPALPVVHTETVCIPKAFQARWGYPGLGTFPGDNP